MTTMESLAKTVLLDRKKAIQRLFQENLEETKHLQEEPEADWPDRAASHEAKDILQRLMETQRRELGEIEAALTRIDKDVYGRCEQCDASIGRNRLRAIPEARYCLACTQQHRLA